jgi:hydrogenase expression/formation protein HypE
MSPNLRIGKIDPDILEKLISVYTHKEDRVLIGAGIGEDAAIIDMGSRYLVAKTDPITHVTSEIGHYAVNINANDIAAMGGKPKWFLATILMPAASSADELKRIFSQLSESCKELGISYCGGHTEVTHSVNNPVVIGHMLGEVGRDNLKPTSEACMGDDLIMTKSSAIEATAIIALEKEKELRGHLGHKLLARAKNYLYNPGISVVKEASVVSSIKEVHALHDPTEGGIATGIFEMATASGLGVEVHYDKIPISEETIKVCESYHVDPLGTFASGSLLIAVSPSVSEDVISRLSAKGITATRIGVMMPQEEGMRLIKNGENLPLPVYHQDEISKIFG